MNSREETNVRECDPVLKCKNRRPARAEIQPPTQQHSPGFRTCKEQGEWAELCFMACARQMGLTVLKPYGDSSSYDVGIERDGGLVREQIKSTTFSRGHTFTCNLVGPGRKAYVPGVVDFFAIYLVPIDRWYIIPFAAASKTSVSLQFTPQKQGHKYECCLEAWHLLRE
jgi:hypothetical protein